MGGLITVQTQRQHRHLMQHANDGRHAQATKPGQHENYGHHTHHIESKPI